MKNLILQENHNKEIDYDAICYLNRDGFITVLCYIHDLYHDPYIEMAEHILLYEEMKIITQQIDTLRKDK